MEFDEQSEPAFQYKGLHTKVGLRDTRRDPSPIHVRANRDKKGNIETLDKYFPVPLRSLEINAEILSNASIPSSFYTSEVHGLF